MSKILDDDIFIVSRIHKIPRTLHDKYLKECEAQSKQLVNGLLPVVVFAQYPTILF